MTTLMDVYDLVLPWIMCIQDLSTMDALATHVCAHNRRGAGAWCQYGRRSFRGIRLEEMGDFDDVARKHCRHWRQGQETHADWKFAVRRVAKRILMLQAPFIGNEIVGIYEDEEEAYWGTRISTEDAQLYFELHVLENPDRFSWSLTDLHHEDGATSISYHPHTDILLIESDPDRHEVFQLGEPPEADAMRPFTGTLGMAVVPGRGVCFARIGADGAWVVMPMVPLTWAVDGTVKPVLAFRKRGLYRIKSQNLRSGPPFPLPTTTVLA
jgi:hypothetical protein